MPIDAVVVVAPTTWARTSDASPVYSSAWDPPLGSSRGISPHLTSPTHPPTLPPQGPWWCNGADASVKTLDRVWEQHHDRFFARSHWIKSNGTTRAFHEVAKNSPERTSDPCHLIAFSPPKPNPRTSMSRPPSAISRASTSASPSREDRCWSVDSTDTDYSSVCSSCPDHRQSDLIGHSRGSSSREEEQRMMEQKLDESSAGIGTEGILCLCLHVVQDIRVVSI